MLLYFRNAQPFARAQVEDPSEEVLQMLVSLQWRRVEVSMLDLPAEFEPLATFQFKLLFKWFLSLSFELKGILMHEQEKE